MPDNPLLRIGPFSRASSLSVKALRAYHEAGLLVPAEVDPATGYRSYSVAQLTDAAIIRRLRLLDVPLEAIGQVLAARDPAVTSKVLAEHGSVLDARLTETQRAIDELNLALEAPATHTPVHVRHEPAQTVLAINGEVTQHAWLPFLVRSRVTLVDAASACGAVVGGSFGGCYPTLLDDDVQALTAFLPVTAPALLPADARSNGVRVNELPAVDVAVLALRGDYDGLYEAYRTLGAWVAANREPADMPVRELYLVGPASTDDPDEYRTEICWPLHTQEAPE